MGSNVRIDKDTFEVVDEKCTGESFGLVVHLIRTLEEASVKNIHSRIGRNVVG